MRQGADRASAAVLERCQFAVIVNNSPDFIRPLVAEGAGDRGR
ncbi:MAG TPA: hypothetical protein VKI99_11135 [Candidatus Dormibacteraeota bacterium]|nr:hypothetical protein [Candidatus Dormibacteraeota bacterium]